jgi:hypothetical protein
MTRTAKVEFDTSTNKWIATFQGVKLVSSASKQYVEEAILSGRSNKAKKLGVNTIEFSNVDLQYKNIKEAHFEHFDINERFSFVENLVTMIANKNIPSMIITGEGGLGKTFTVIQTLKNSGLKDTRDFLTNTTDDETDEEVWMKKGDYTVVKGFSTAKGLYRTLFENRNKLVIFDDCDNVLKDTTALMILKSALDSYDERWINWNAEPIKDDGLPRSFRFTGSVIFISNQPLMKIDQAIRSRSICVDLHMTDKQKIKRMEKIICSEEFMQEFSFNIKKDALNFLEKHASECKELNLRTLISVVKIRAAIKDWEKLALYIITM